MLSPYLVVGERRTRRRTYVLPIVATIATAFSASSVIAQSIHDDEHTTQLAPVVVTANPLGSSLFDLVSPISVMNKTEISDRGASTLGETLNGIPGVRSSYFGPNASRPVIRGMDADRVKILQNGVGSLDASALSQDHAVPIDPLVIDQLEVVRGPAALLYGGSAVGGVVNALDNRVPQDAITTPTGRAEVRYGGADKQSSGSVVLETGNGSVAIHADGFQRTTEDLSIPGYARSAQRRAQSPQADEPSGRLRNSGSKTDGAALGGSITFDQGYAGLSVSNYNSDYGTVAEANVRIKMKSDKWDFGSEIRDISPLISKVKVRLSQTDYEHREIDTGVVGTIFRNKGTEGSIEATHTDIAGLKGAVGLQFHQSDFSALGDEALVPAVRTESKAAYIYEELPFEKLKLTFGGRVERAKLKSAGGGTDDPSQAPGTPRFGSPRDLSFTPVSFAAGALYPLSSVISIGSNFSHTERAPVYNELFTNGPHVATGQYEVGNTNLGVEKSNGVDLQLRWREGAHSASVSGFYTRFNNYITTFSTGNRRDSDGTINATGDLAEAIVSAVPARFTGFEAESKLHVYEGKGDVDLRLKADYVRAVNLNTGEPLPRIAPMQLGVGLDYRLDKFGAKLDTTFAAKQTRVASNELPTDGYTLVNAQVSYRLAEQPNAEVFAKVSNLLNQEIRLHTSVLKEIAPLGGRSLMLGLRGSF